MNVDSIKLKKTFHEYDAFNRRVETTLESYTSGVLSSTDVTELVYGGQSAWQLIAEYDRSAGGNLLTAEYVYGNYIDEVIQMRKDDNNDGRTTTGDDAAAFQWSTTGDTCNAISDVSGGSPIRTNGGGAFLVDWSAGSASLLFDSKTDPNNAVTNVLWTINGGGTIDVTFDTTANQGSVTLTAELDFGGGCIVEIDLSFDVTDADDPAYYYHQDDLFSVYAITDDASTPAVVERYEYGDYGTPGVLTPAGATQSNPLESTIGNRHMYTGRLWDTATELHEYRHRWMWSDGGRFIQRDPLRYADGMNMFEYVMSTPYCWTDPSGLQCANPNYNAPPGKECDPAWRHWRPGRDIPGCGPGTPDWYKYSPVCSDITWCDQVFRNRVANNALPGIMGCMKKSLYSVSPIAVKCIVACLLAGTIVSPALGIICASGCGVVGAAVWIANLITCMNQTTFVTHTAHISYCGCIAWKAQKCPNNPEPLVRRCNPGAATGTPPPPGWTP